MAKKSYIGVSSAARKVKKVYIGIGGVARKVKKIYIGIGNIAKQIFGGAELVYYGKIKPDDNKLRERAVANVGDYLVFQGGRYIEDGTNYVYAHANAFNRALTHTRVDFVLQRYLHSGASVGNYAIFAGGIYYDTRYNSVSALNPALTISNPSVLSVARDSMASASVGNYAIFAGGYNGGAKNNVDAYNTSLTKSNPTALSATSYRKVGLTIGNHAVFVGGTNRIVNAYDTSLTRKILADCNLNGSTYGNIPSGATTLGNYGIFAPQNSSVKGVKVFDTSLTVIDIADFSYARNYYSGTTVGDFAIFGGGTSSTKLLEIYDSSLTKVENNNIALSEYSSYCVAGTNGNYALFTNGAYASTFDIFTIN